MTLNELAQTLVEKSEILVSAWSKDPNRSPLAEMIAEALYAHTTDLRAELDAMQKKYADAIASLNQTTVGYVKMREERDALAKAALPKYIIDAALAACAAAQREAGAIAENAHWRLSYWGCTTAFCDDIDARVAAIQRGEVK